MAKGARYWLGDMQECLEGTRGPWWAERAEQAALDSAMGSTTGTWQEWRDIRETECPPQETVGQDNPGRPRVEIDSYTVYPSCYEQMGNSDRDIFCLTVVDGHAWGWAIRRGRGSTMSDVVLDGETGKFVLESRADEANKARRWPRDEALAVACRWVDQVRVNGSTAADCAARWPRAAQASV